MMMVVLRSLYQTGGLSNNNKNNNVLSLKNIYIYYRGVTKTITDIYMQNK